jgi:hypothetical protein
MDKGMAVRFGDAFVFVESFPVEALYVPLIVLPLTLAFLTLRLASTARESPELLISSLYQSSITGVECNL